MERVIIDIDNSGVPKIRVEGVKGAACKKLTADLERALGSVTQRKRTSEFALKAATKQQQKGGR